MKITNLKSATNSVSSDVVGMLMKYVKTIKTWQRSVAILFNLCSLFSVFQNTHMCMFQSVQLIFNSLLRKSISNILVLACYVFMVKTRIIPKRHFVFFLNHHTFVTFLLNSNSTSYQPWLKLRKAPSKVAELLHFTLVGHIEMPRLLDLMNWDQLILFSVQIQTSNDRYNNDFRKYDVILQNHLISYKLALQYGVNHVLDCSYPSINH